MYIGDVHTIIYALQIKTKGIVLEAILYESVSLCLCNCELPKGAFFVLFDATNIISLKFFHFIGLKSVEGNKLQGH